MAACGVQKEKIQSKASMQTVISLILSTCFFSVLYQYLAPKFSRGAVAFQPVAVTDKLLFGLAMSLSTQLLLFGLTLLSSVILVPLLVLLGSDLIVSPPSAAAMVLFAAIMLTVLQLANWFSTMLLGRFMPTILRVDSPSAAFKAALAPTLVSGTFYLLMMFWLAPILAATH